MGLWGWPQTVGKRLQPTPPIAVTFRGSRYPHVRRGMEDRFGKPQFVCRRMRETNGLVYLIISFNLVGRKMWVSMDKYIQYVDMYNELGCQHVKVFATRQERHSLILIKVVYNRGDMFDYLYIFTFFSLFTYMLVCFFFLVMI